MQKYFVLAGVLIIVLQVTSCTRNDRKDQKGENIVAGKSIDAVLQEHTDELMAIPGVVGTAQGLCKNKPCIIVFVTRKTAELEKKIPRELDGYPVELEETGEVRALPG